MIEKTSLSHIKIFLVAYYDSNDHTKILYLVYRNQNC